MFFGGGSAFSSALGRGSGLTGRTDIWGRAIAAADNPIIGTGFESFWNAKRRESREGLRGLGFTDMSNLVSAHNGYLEVYLDIGLVGLCLIVLVLISGYRRAYEAFRRDPRTGQPDVSLHSDWRLLQHNRGRLQVNVSVLDLSATGLGQCERRCDPPSLLHPGLLERLNIAGQGTHLGAEQCLPLRLKFSGEFRVV